MALGKVFTRSGTLFSIEIADVTTLLAALLLRLPGGRTAVVTAEHIGMVLPEGLTLLRCGGCDALVNALPLLL